MHYIDRKAPPKGVLFKTAAFRKEYRSVEFNNYGES